MGERDMALIKCPECGKEISDRSKVCIHCGYPLQNENNKSIVYIECPECGKEVSDTARVCSNCGYDIKEHFDRIGREIKKQENIETKEDSKSFKLDKNEVENNQEPLRGTSSKKLLFGVCSVLAIFFIIIIVLVASKNIKAKKCTFPKCSNYKIEGSNYCKEHTCKKEGCNFFKATSDIYCPIHAKEYLGSQDTLDENINNENLGNDSDVAEESISEIKKGETIYLEDLEFTLNKVEFSYDVVPENPPSFYRHYPADTGQVYIHIDADIKNLQKSDLYCDDIYTATADYDEGYTYRGSAIVEDTDGNFTYANITSISPLQTLGVHQLIECPEEVGTSGKPINIILRFNNGLQYKYVFR